MVKTGCILHSTDPISKQQLSSADSKPTSASLFRQLFEADKNRLYAYIYAFVSNRAIADDIFQETCLTLWKEFEKFEPGTNFSKWANVIAFNRVRHYRQVNKKYQLGLSDDFLQEFSRNIAIMESRYDSQEQKWRHLEHCKSLLSAPLRDIYQRFYAQNLTAPEIAQSTGRSIHAIRKAVHKLRKRLFDCVEQKNTGASV
ncbi:RNA polymerase subunit sigma [Alteromonas aestuariivivens]|uniref:RNA polymerase subunit sigma n=1 Tax=Alteromonas aestuariivivens TaxID=1938339 RepID=A0A3D8MBL4_9ALTE|nr:sigma-70 family RNA polymerase sigma factor [Alteromonas aestuariivivens]RDV27379.1 RNA polymerase subunit sigma [Alteromonas aestuariivivens]